MVHWRHTDLHMRQARRACAESDTRGRIPLQRGWDQPFKNGRSARKVTFLGRQIKDTVTPVMNRGNRVLAQLRNSNCSSSSVWWNTLSETTRKPWSTHSLKMSSGSGSWSTNLLSLQQSSHQLHQINKFQPDKEVTIYTDASGFASAWWMRRKRSKVHFFRGVRARGEIVPPKERDPRRCGVCSSQGHKRPYMPSSIANHLSIEI